ncbi:MAG TPA: hypothetical protein VGO34_15855 [Alphaproteobacteria bacterium]|jgi:hypothetical protein
MSLFRTACALLLSGLLWVCLDVRALADDRPLLKITKFNIAIDGFDEDSEACGLSSPYLEAAARMAAKRAPFSIEDGIDENSALYLLVDTFKSKDLCITHIYLTASYDYLTQLPASPDPQMGHVTLWENTSFVVTNHNRQVHLAAVIGEVNGRISELVREWQKQNSSPI